MRGATFCAEDKTREEKVCCEQNIGPWRRAEAELLYECCVPEVNEAWAQTVVGRLPGRAKGARGRRGGAVGT